MAYVDENTITIVLTRRTWTIDVEVVAVERILIHNI
jgi:hypothetical protein